MNRLRLLSLALTLPALAAASAACGDASSSGAVALREALASTAGRTEGRAFTPTPAPLAAAGPHRLTVTAEITLDAPGGAETLRIQRTLDRDGAGRFHGVDHRTSITPTTGPDGAEDGREGVFDGVSAALRRRFGPWVAADVLDGAHDRFLRALYGLGGDVLAAFGDYITWQEVPGRDTILVGLPVRWSTAALNGRVAPRPLPDAELAALRDHETRWAAWAAATHRPTEVRGELARTVPGGEIVAGHLEIRGEARVEGQGAAFAILVDYAVSPLPKDASFTLPESTLPAARPRTWRMIEEVLGEDLDATYRVR